MRKIETILILDFGGQYNQLIARRVRECNVYCEVHPYTLSIEKIKEINPRGIIFTGGPNSVYGEDSPRCNKAIFELGVPILGICYGSQLMAHLLGGTVETAPISEYGKTEVAVDRLSKIFKDVSDKTICWMSHTDYISQVPGGFKITATTPNCPVAAFENEDKKFYATQFHPEVMHTQEGQKMIKAFVYDVCGCKGDWVMSSFVEKTIQQLREKIGDGRVLLALSGGVDSSVLAALLAEAIGERLTCVFVDHGLMRKNEGDEIEKAFDKWNINFVRINAEERFLKKLSGVTDPQEKRKIIGAEFGYVFVEEASKFKITNKDFFAQGTIYPDVIESGLGDADTIKGHHNRLLPKELIERFNGVLEPLALLFKDEVREMGRELGLSEYLVSRQPFPGPGLAIRIIGEVTKEKADILREADAIFREEIAKSGWNKKISQYFAVLTDSSSVGVMGDARTYEKVLVLRAVNTSDFMTADWTRIPYELLDKISVRIVNEVPHVNRICYDITSKPPGTVEWE